VGGKMAMSDGEGARGVREVVVVVVKLWELGSIEEGEHQWYQ